MVWAWFGPGLAWFGSAFARAVLRAPCVRSLEHGNQTRVQLGGWFESGLGVVWPGLSASCYGAVQHDPLFLDGAKPSNTRAKPEPNQGQGQAPTRAKPGWRDISCWCCTVRPAQENPGWHDPCLETAAHSWWTCSTQITPTFVPTAVACTQLCSSTRWRLRSL